jgi:hypothetical protein
MSSQRVEEFVRAAQDSSDGTARVAHLCRLAAGTLPVNGVGLSLTGGSGRHSRVAATDEVSGKIEDLQVLLGQGPCVDAVSAGAPVLVADMTRSSVQARWPVFASSVVDIGVRAAFALPLMVGDLRLGAMDLYRDDVGSLDLAQLDEAQDYATAAVEVLLELHTRADAGGVRSLSAGWGATSVVAQATGMVMVQMDVDANAAFAALRARAYREDRVLQDVARDVIERRSRLDGPPR